MAWTGTWLGGHEPLTRPPWASPSRGALDLNPPNSFKDACPLPGAMLSEFFYLQWHKLPPSPKQSKSSGRVFSCRAFRRLLPARLANLVQSAGFQRAHGCSSPRPKAEDGEPPCKPRCSSGAWGGRLAAELLSRNRLFSVRWTLRYLIF